MATLMDVIMQEYGGASLQDRQAGAVRARRQSMINQPTGFEGNQGRAFEQEIYRANPSRLGMGMPAPQMDQFRETLPTAAEQAQFDPIMRRVQSAAGAPMVQLSTPMTTEDIATARRQPAEAPIFGYNPERGAFGLNYERAIRPFRDVLSPAPSGMPQAPTYGTPSFPTPTFSTGVNRVIDRVASTITGTPTPSASAAAAATAPVQAASAPMMPSTMVGRGDYNDVFNVPYTPALGANYNDVFNAPYTPPAVRQRPLPEVLASRDERTVAPKREPGFFERIFGGTQYQSNNLPLLMQPQGPMPVTGAPMPEAINYGDPNNAADFFRADRLLMQQNPAMFGLLGGSNG